MRTMPMISLISLASLLSPSTAVANQGGEWRPLASMHVPRQECGAARIGDRVYVAGGLIASPQGATDTVEVYDVTNDRWDFVAPMPIAMDHLGVSAAGGKLYVTGGFSGDFVPRTDAFVY